jgi:pimeloyl-ACP methyl ester carboxylesterase
MSVSSDDVTGQLAAVNGLALYYETRGTGRPLVLIHGALMTIGLMQDYPARLAAGRQVIAVERQGHGHTADAARPLRFEQMADDIAALLDHLGLPEADLFGFSIGAAVALQVAIRHPARARRVVAASATYRTDGLHPELAAGDGADGGQLTGACITGPTRRSRPTPGSGRDWWPRSSTSTPSPRTGRPGRSPRSPRRSCSSWPTTTSSGWSTQWR